MIDGRFYGVVSSRGIDGVRFWVHFPHIYVRILTASHQEIPIWRKDTEVKLALSVINFLDGEHWEVLTENLKKA